MSGVVLRCPNCGTTKASAGECEACHEADVRYFCTNHKPGLWLDRSECPQCGAQFGQKSVPGRPAGRAAPVDTVPSSTRGADAGRAAQRRKTPVPPRAREEPASDPRTGEERRRAAIREAVLASFPKMVRRPRRADPVADPDYLPVPVAAGAALGGCFIRAIFLALFLLFALFLGGLFVGGSLLQGFGGVVVF